MILRDRHRPSIFIWSVGNEIVGRYQQQGITRAQELTALVHALDADLVEPSQRRAVTSAVPVPGGHPPDAFSTPFDVISYNYGCSFSSQDGCGLFARKRSELKNGTRLFLSSESLPMQSAELWQVAWPGMHMRVLPTCLVPSHPPLPRSWPLHAVLRSRPSH